MTCHRVVILAGGKGTRLHPFTASFPKPLVPLGNMPILEVVLRQLAVQGFHHATLTLGHLAELIKAYILQRPALSERMTIDFVDETEPTGTAGSLAAIVDLTDTFVVMNGDVLTNLDYGALVAAHKASGAAITIASHSKQVKIDLGILHADSGDFLTRYVEKPEYHYDVSMGIYVYEPKVLQHIRRAEYLDFPDLVQRLIAKGEKVFLYRNNAFWLDIGRPEDYALAQTMFENDVACFGIGAL